MKAPHLSCASWLGIVWLFLCLQLVKETDGVMDGSEWQMTEALVKAVVPNPSNRLSHARISRLWTLQDFGYSLILTDLVRSYNTKCRNVVQTVIFQIFLQSLPGFEWGAIVSQSLAADQFQRIPTIPCTLQVLRWNVMRHEIVCARCARCARCAWCARCAPCRESKCSLEILTS